MDVPSSRCGFLVVQSYESRLVPGSRLSALHKRFIIRGILVKLVTDVTGGH